MRRAIPILALLTAVLALTAMTLATPQAGRLRVRVADAAGPLPGAAVTVSHPALLKQAVTRSADARGVALFTGLRPADGYVVTVSFPGFADRRVTGVAVVAGDTRDVVVTLVEALQEQVRVVAKGEPSLVLHRAAVYAPPAARDFKAKKLTIVAERDRDWNTESYDHTAENPFHAVATSPLSTFSIDVDSASYSNVRRFLRRGQLPPPGAVRIEELINAFRYDGPLPRAGEPFAVDVEVGEAPWNPRHRLARIGVHAPPIELGDRPPANLVFLLDVSGSMNDPAKLPLVKQSMRLLVETLRGDDRVAIVVYAGAAGLVLPPTPASDELAILEAIDRLQAGGSTAGGAGIELAYRTAADSFVAGGVNRVILATDGDFNVGISDRSSLVRMIEARAKSGVFLTVLGFGMGNYKDDTLEQLADHGNGNYAYIDSPLEARRVLVEQVGATLVTVAKDVKLQVEFNPARVAAYRLIGYENRMLADRDFEDDTKDAGEIGAGHTVTALYELVPPGLEDEVVPRIDLRYRDPATPPRAGEDASAELLTVKVRYKAPDGDTSRLLTASVIDTGLALASTSDDFRFAASVAAFGMLLRGGEHVGDLTMADVGTLAGAARGRDEAGHRAGFLELVDLAAPLLAADAER